LICLSVVLLVAIVNDVLVDPALVGSIKFGVTQTPHQWNSGGMPYDVGMVLERRNGLLRLRGHDEFDKRKNKQRELVNNTEMYHLALGLQMSPLLRILDMPQEV